jgi:hypothetical protein
MQDVLDKLSHTSCTREEKSNLLYNTKTFFSSFVLRGLVWFRILISTTEVNVRHTFLYPEHGGSRFF